MKNAYVLEGFGIECEKETLSFLKQFSAFEVQPLFLPQLLSRKDDLPFEDGDLIFFSGRIFF